MELHEVSTVPNTTHIKEFMFVKEDMSIAAEAIAILFNTLQG